jgi:hypothetical protein
MKIVKQVMVAAMVGAWASAPASAAFLQNWYFDYDGAAGMQAATTTQVSEYLDIVGTSYIKNSFSGPLSFTFEDWGAFKATAHDGGGGLNGSGSNELTALFHLTGTGTLGSSINFNSGAVGDFVDVWVQNGGVDFASTNDIYGANNGTKIGTFAVAFGGGTINASGIPNGFLTIALKPLSLTSGHFFLEDSTDLATTDLNFVFGFVTTNASVATAVNSTVNGEIVQEFAGDSSLPTSDPPNRFVVGNNGQYRWVVPEPGTVALIGLGLLGLVGLSRLKSGG